METCKSPRTVLNAAYALGKDVLPEYRSTCSRHDFTLPQLFACLALREHQKKSYRGVEALLKDCPDWCADIGLTRVPDHNTLQRSFDVIVTVRRTNKMLDEQAACFDEAGVLRLSAKPLAMDSTHLESHHVSRHFEKRREQTAKATPKEAADAEKSGKTVAKPDKANSFTRPKTVKRLPKLTLAVAAACHVILAAVASTGAGADHPHFEPVLFQAWRRAAVKTAVADAGFDSEKNHRLGRLEMTVRTVIPPEIGRPSKDGKPPNGYYRRLMHQRFKRKADKEVYGQRWQSETVNSMIKRNLGAALRARTEERREREMLLRVVVHNVMLACGLSEG
jgi:Transposase DDE domain